MWKELNSPTKTEQRLLRPSSCGGSVFTSLSVDENQCSGWRPDNTALSPSWVHTRVFVLKQQHSSSTTSMSVNTYATPSVITSVTSLKGTAVCLELWHVRVSRNITFNNSRRSMKVKCYVVDLFNVLKIEFGGYVQTPLTTNYLWYVNYFSLCGLIDLFNPK